MIKKAFCLLIAIISLCSTTFQAREPEQPTFSIEGVGTATQGTYLVKVSLVTKNRNVSDRELVSAAVRGVLFRGFSDPTSRVTQKPLAGSAANEAQHAQFYSEFFGKNGTASEYGSVLSGSRTVVKAEGKYKVSATVSIQKETLLKYLQDAGIVKSLNSIF